MPQLTDTTSYALQVDGVTLAVFRRVSGLAYETDVLEVRETTADGRVVLRRQPGATRWKPLMLERRADHTPALDQWRQMVLEGADGARRDGEVVQFDSTLTEVARWRFSAGWPSGWSLRDGSETVTIVHEGLVRT